MSRNRLYTLLLLACAAGYTWLGFSMQAHDHHFASCLFKATTGIPCPSCGITRSIEALLHTDFKQAFYLNPLGFLILPLIVIVPVWIMADLLQRKQTCWQAYQSMEHLFRRKPVALTAILLILTNWIWNISKGL